MSALNDEGQSQSTPVITEAYLVEDKEEEDDVEEVENTGEVYIATPMEPWWKHRKAKFLLWAFFIVLLIFSIALGMSLTLGDSAVEDMPQRSFPSLSTSPSARLSVGPSSSLMPSSSPTTCAERIIANAQQIDLQLAIPSNVDLALDGTNMVIVTTDLGFSSTFVIFYSLESTSWERVDRFTLGSPSKEYSVAISGQTAIVGLPDANEGAGEVLIYEENSVGVWGEIYSSIIAPTNSSLRWGHFISIDGNLACVGSAGSMSIFHRRHGDFHLPQNKWSHLKTISVQSPERCYVAGNIIAVQSQVDGLFLYKYKRPSRVFSLMQDPIRASVASAALNQHYLAYSDSNGISTIYGQRGSNQTFVFSQQMNNSNSDGRGKISMADEIMVLEDRNRTIILLEHDGHWSKSILLDRSFDHYQVSGQKLVATIENGVHYYDLQGCAQFIPIQPPTSSIIPTSAPCYGIEIAVVYDSHPRQTSWGLQGMDEMGDFAVLASHQAAVGDTFYTEYVCLPEGEYNFTIIDSAGDGICCERGGREGNYNITSSSGQLIKEGGEFENSETTLFVLPYRPAPSSLPSSPPSMTPLNALFGDEGHSSGLNKVAMNEDRVVIVSETDIHFFSVLDGVFEITTKIDIDYPTGSGSTSIAINNSTVVIGSPGNSWDTNYTGAAYVYQEDENGIWSETMSIVPNDIRQEASFGSSLDVDGNIMVVGASNDGENGQGSVYIYRWNGENWIQETKITPPDDSKVEEFGISVSVKDNRIVVGDYGYGHYGFYDDDFGHYDDEKGAVFVYEFDSLKESWVQVGGFLINNDDSGGFGLHVELVEDEDLVVSSHGSIYYYEKHEESYVLKQRIIDNNSMSSIAVGMNEMVVSEDEDNGDCVLIFRFFLRKNHVWEEVNQLDNSDIGVEFGWRGVALFGNTTLIVSYHNVHVFQDYFRPST